jgi:hypothetical protein
MQTIKLPFTETEQHIGYIETDSGTLLFADGIWGPALPSVDQKVMVVDTETERTKFPVYTVMRNGQRFLLIALDANAVNTHITAEDDRVTVDEPLSEEELEERKPTEESL